MRGAYSISLVQASELSGPRLVLDALGRPSPCISTDGAKPSRGPVLE